MQMLIQEGDSNIPIFLEEMSELKQIDRIINKWLEKVI
jgi:hypothetical protein